MTTGFLTIKEVSEQVGLHRTTLWKMQQRNEFPETVRLTASGSRVGFRAEEIEKWKLDPKAWADVANCCP